MNPTAAASASDRERLRPVARQLTDRAARRVVSAGGLAVIASVLGILVFLVAVAAPLGLPSELRPAGSLPGGAAARALLLDEHRTHVAALGADGVVRVLELESGDEVVRSVLSEPGNLRAARAVQTGTLLAAGTADGRVVIQPVGFGLAFEGGTRRVIPRLDEPVSRLARPDGGAVEIFTAGHADERTTIAAVAPGGVLLTRSEREENPFTGAVSGSEQQRLLAVPEPVTQLALDEEQRNLFAATAGGGLLWWDLVARPDSPPVRADGEGPVTAVALLIGGRGLVTGHQDGAIEIWFPLHRGAAGGEIAHVRGFDGLGAPVRHLVPSLRDRSFLAAAGNGALGLFYSTSHRELWRGEGFGGDPAALAYAPKGDGALLASGDRIHRMDVENAHPATSLGALFGRVWYEGYALPEFVWQSTGGTDEFEPKLSLTPLMVGTLKGTLYSLLLAVPLGILGAMYTSQFLHPRLQRIVKPTIEVMASLPSVVLGFLAGLWLAPRLEGAFPALLLMLLLVPPISLATGFAWSLLPRRVTARLPDGSELLPHALMLVLGMAACIGLSAGFEAAAFAGDFPAWLRQTTGLTYDQRNAVVVGLAMGFAVIPIVFSISEDAFSSVPPTLAAGSLALGASRWQTVARIMLPAASPGLFAAVMIGFGRAVGETMIVLMATGNTPILDWNPFNGFRTLSANIAVEIPEAPHGGTLYRVLFVAALLLFALTFVINTASELVRQRLRARFGRF